MDERMKFIYANADNDLNGNCNTVLSKPPGVFYQLTGLTHVRRTDSSWLLGPLVHGTNPLQTWKNPSTERKKNLHVWLPVEKLKVAKQQLQAEIYQVLAVNQPIPQWLAELIINLHLLQNNVAIHKTKRTKTDIFC